MAVTFHAREPGACAKTLNIQITDAESLLGVVDTLPVALTAEAYDIKVKVEWPGEASATPEAPVYMGLDFGSFKVVDTRTSSLELINEGKYPVGFKFLFKSKMMRNILKIEPEEGLLEPATEAPAAGAPPPKKGEPPPPAGGPSRLKILVTLKADAEYTLKGNTDVRLRFTASR